MSTHNRSFDSNATQPTMWCGPNDGGIKRGDSAETGDEEARPTGSALSDNETGALEGDLGDLSVRDADDPSLGLTDIGPVPPEDWAANTGPTHSAEERDRVAWDQLKSKPSRKG